MIYRPEVAVGDVRERAALAIYSTLLGGSMGSRLFDEIREKRGLCYSVYAISHAFADVPILQLGSGLDSTKTIEAYTRMREIVDELRDDGPTEEEVERARAYAAGRLVLAFENSGAVARHAANQRSCSASRSTPTRRSPRSTPSRFDEVREVAAGHRGPPRRRGASGRTRRRSSRPHPPRPCDRRAARAAEAQPVSGDVPGRSASFAMRGSSPTISRIQPAASSTSSDRASTIASTSAQSATPIEHRLEHRQRGAVQDRDRAAFERHPSHVRCDRGRGTAGRSRRDRGVTVPDLSLT